MGGSIFSGNIFDSSEFDDDCDGDDDGDDRGGIRVLGRVIVFFLEGLMRILQENEGELRGLIVCMVEKKEKSDF